MKGAEMERRIKTDEKLPIIAPLKVLDHITINKKLIKDKLTAIPLSTPIVANKIAAAPSRNPKPPIEGNAAATHIIGTNIRK